MHPFFAEYLDRLSDIHTACREALAGLSPEALNRRPGPDMNSIAVLITHLTGAERYWIGDVAAGESSDRVRATEFTAEAPDAESLRRRLDETLEYTRGALARFTPADLERDCYSPAHDRQFNAGWALLHALEHSALHCGHIEITRQLLEKSEAGRDG